MAEGTVLVRSITDEKTKDFNKRLRSAWENEPVASATLHVVDGVPVVSMVGALEPATAQDVEDGVAEVEGEPYMSDQPVAFATCRLDVMDAAETEDRLDALCDLAGASIVDIQIVTGDTFTWVKHPETGDQLYVPDKVTYAMVVWEIEFEEEEGDGDGDGEEGQEAKSEPETEPETEPESEEEGDDPNEED